MNMNPTKSGGSSDLHSTEGTGRTPLRWSYWRSVLRFGLPFAVVYRGVDYALFLLAGQSIEPYPWPFYLAVDVCVVAFVSALWWGFKSEIAYWKQPTEGNSRQGAFQRYVEKVIHWCLRGATYWQAVLFFGIPIVFCYQMFNYLLFRLLTEGHEVRYTMFSALKVDVLAVLILSTVWWVLMRLIMSRKPEGK